MSLEGRAHAPAHGAAVARDPDPSAGGEVRVLVVLSLGEERERAQHPRGRGRSHVAMSPQPAVDLEVDPSQPAPNSEARLRPRRPDRMAAPERDPREIVRPVGAPGPDEQALGTPRPDSPRRVRKRELPTSAAEQGLPPQELAGLRDRRLWIAVGASRLEGPPVERVFPCIEAGQFLLAIAVDELAGAEAEERLLVEFVVEDAEAGPDQRLERKVEPRKRARDLDLLLVGQPVTAFPQRRAQVDDEPHDLRIAIGGTGEREPHARDGPRLPFDEERPHRARGRHFPRADLQLEDPGGSVAEPDLERVREPVFVELARARPRRMKDVPDLEAVSEPDPIPEVVQDEKEVVEVIVDGRRQPAFVPAPDNRLHGSVRVLPADIQRELVRPDDVPFPEDVAQVVDVALHVGPKSFEGTVGPGVPPRFDRALDEEKGRLGIPAIGDPGLRSRGRRYGDSLGFGPGRETERRHGDHRGGHSGGHDPGVSRRGPPARHHPTP